VRAGVEEAVASGVAYSDAAAGDTTLRALKRRLATLVPDVAPMDADAVTLETLSSSTEPPRLMSATIVEGGALRPRPVEGTIEAAFAAFLDGTQVSQVLQHADGVPIVRGTVAAVVRQRRNRRFTTWRHIVATSVYAPRALLSQRWNDALDQLALRVVDTTVDRGNAVIAHPYAVRDAAIHFVQTDRETVEHRLAKEWCGMTREPLFVDGGISGTERFASEACIVGVVKSHRTLYAEGDALRAVYALRTGERSSVFRITSPKRSTVASWYLRLRDATGRDPMWGLVRVEIPYDGDATTDRADQLSCWILAEVSPLALPDSRWDKMVYGIRDCEEFLRAVT